MPPSIDARDAVLCSWVFDFSAGVAEPHLSSRERVGELLRRAAGGWRAARAPGFGGGLAATEGEWVRRAERMALRPEMLAAQRENAGRDGRMRKVFYPVFPPDRRAADVVNWLEGWCLNRKGRHTRRSSS